MNTRMLRALSVVLIVSLTVTPLLAQTAPLTTPRRSGAAPQAVTEVVKWTAGVGYTYDGAGNIIEIGADKFVYDDVGRLVLAEVNAAKRTYSYDAFGNRLTCQHSTPETGVSDCQFGWTVSSGNNRLNQASYDPAGAGNVVGFGPHTYSYDALNMVTRDSNNGLATDYIYTAADERIALHEPANGRWEWTVRDTDNKVLREFTSQNGTFTWKKDYVWRNGLLLASRQPEQDTVTTYHYHLDHLGTPRRVTDQKDVIVGVHDYYAFGPEISGGTQEPSRTALKYTGHERDSLQDQYSLDYMHARYYNYNAGRFMTVDPLLDLHVSMNNPQRWNRYSYVTNDPIGRVDPDGREENFYMEQLFREQQMVGDGKMSIDTYWMRRRSEGVGALIGVAGAGLWMLGAAIVGTGSIAEGAFALAPIARGWLIEAALAAKFGGALPRNFPTIDRFFRGIATSVKSIDLRAATYQNVTRLSSTLTGYIDKLAQFNGARHANVVVQGNQISQRVLELAIPRGAATPEQMAAIQRAMVYAQQNNVTVKVIQIK